MEKVHDPSNWGMSADLYGQGYVAPDGRVKRQRDARLLDVRRPPTVEGWGSYDWTIYANAFYRNGPDSIPDAEPLPDHVLARVEIGNGGVTRIEEFEFPAVGKVMHVVADSIRLDVRLKEPESNGEFWHVTAGLAIGNLLPGMTRRRTRITATEVPPTPGFSEKIAIPYYAERMRFRAINLGAVEYQFFYQGPSTTGYFPAFRSAVEHTNWLFLPLPVAYVQLSSAVTQDVEIAFDRPS